MKPNETPGAERVEGGWVIRSQNAHFWMAWYDGDTSWSYQNFMNRQSAVEALATRAASVKR